MHGRRNCSLTVLNVYEDGLRLVCLNSTDGALPEETLWLLAKGTGWPFLPSNVTMA
jgi:hypothetical protein